MEMLETCGQPSARASSRTSEQPLGGGPTAGAGADDNHLPDVHTRLILLQVYRLAAGRRRPEGLQVEMIDRFGLLPEPTKNLMRLTLLKLQAEKPVSRKSTPAPGRACIEVAADTCVDPLVLIRLGSRPTEPLQVRGGAPCSNRRCPWSARKNVSIP